jgi:hypothetical protein
MYSKTNLISELIEARQSENLKFDESRLKEVFTLIKSAKETGYLGANRPKSCCLVKTVNAANQMLRERQDRDFFRSLVATEEDDFYIYIALTSLKCFDRVYSLAA